MGNSNSEYQGKPTAYLDHNILDLIVKNPSIAFKAEVKDKFQVIYSDENLKEIKRTGEKGPLYLKVLDDLEAMYLKIILTPQFELTSDATLTIQNPFEAFENYCQNIEPIYEEIEKSTSQSLLKFYGGRNGDDFDDINNEQIDSFDNLMNHIKNLINDCDGIDEHHPGIKAYISTYTKDMMSGNSCRFCRLIRGSSMLEKWCRIEAVGGIVI